MFFCFIWLVCLSIHLIQKVSNFLVSLRLCWSYSHFRRGTLSWENAPPVLVYGQACGKFSFLIDWYGWAHPTKCGTSLVWVVLNNIRKQTKQSTRRKLVSKTPQWLLLQLLPLSFYPLWVLALTPFSGGLWSETASWN